MHGNSSRPRMAQKEVDVSIPYGEMGTQGNICRRESFRIYTTANSRCGVATGWDYWGWRGSLSVKVVPLVVELEKETSPWRQRSVISFML